jgi:hypothetical protein
LSWIAWPYSWTITSASSASSTPPVPVVICLDSGSYQLFSSVEPFTTTTCCRLFASVKPSACSRAWTRSRWK